MKKQKTVSIKAKLRGVIIPCLLYTSCGELVMCYPPGIPILAPGEMITPEIIEYIVYAKEKGCSMQGTEDPEVENLNVLAKK